ncbi:hypothetical protein F4808DRAFT_469726 [Astrocystis sublimbata]|nr:hypothetical protein F4808DRAFT_469726 [Astrocystis sublimbata]
MSPALQTTIPYPVYVGTWTNWSRGQIFGGTLTLRRREADLLIAFTAFFIAFVATRIWRIVCFSIHRLVSKETPQNAVYHQHQAVIRNASTPEDGILLLANIIRGGKGSKGRFRPLSTTAVATICIIAFTIASGYSSSVSTAIGDEVLIQSANCGQSVVGERDFYVRNFFSGAYRARQINSAANYAQQCYSSDGGLLDCDRFVEKQIVGHVDRYAECPFQNDICRSRSSNIRIDSGYLSSHDTFGLNSPPGHRVFWRNVYHCAPLVTTGYTSKKNTSFGEATLYHYGNTTGPLGAQDYIFAAKSIKDQYAFAFSDASIVDYSILDIQPLPADVQGGKIRNGSTLFLIDSIFREDADVTIHFLSGNGVAFVEPSSDAWYQVAAAPVNQSFISANSSAHFPFYLPSEPSSPLGCTDQHQFCKSISGKRQCGPLASLRDAVAGAVDLFDITYNEFAASNATNRKAALFLYVARAVSDLSIIDLIGQLGSSSLQSQTYLANSIQYVLAKDQWQLDVAHWWNISMAARQAAFIGHAYGPTDQATLSQRINYTMPELRELCESQKTRTTAYGSFSLFGLVFVFLIGCSFVITSYLLEPVSTYLYRKKGYKKYEHLEWTSNSTLQLQRLAQEKAGFGTWSNCTDLVPRAKEGELLGELDISNPSHPTLKPLCREQRSLNNTWSSFSASNAVHGAAQNQEASLASSRRSLQSVRSNASLEDDIQLPQAHEATIGSEWSHTTADSQDNSSLPCDTHLSEGQVEEIQIQNIDLEDANSTLVKK